MRTTLVAVRLERTHEVLRELLRALKEALPILVGVAGPLAIASVALLAWAGVPLAGVIAHHQFVRHRGPLSPPLPAPAAS